MSQNFIVNALSRTLSTMFPEHFTNTKHQNYYADYGYPQVLEFQSFYVMFKRSGIARAGIVRPIERCWYDMPALCEMQPEDREGQPETRLEQNIRNRFDELQFWARIREADQRSRVGNYGGVIFRFADGKLHNQPVDRVPGGIEGLVEVIPFYESQLRVSTWDTDERSTTYGQPTMYLFNEAEIYDSDQRMYKTRSFDVHPDRVHIWSRDSTVTGIPSLEAGFNDLVTIEKIIGAGGEGFWKNAKSAPVLNVDKDANMQQLAQALGVPIEELPDKLDEVVGDWQKGFDQLLMLQGIDAKSLGVTLPQPEEFMMTALQSFAASISIPLKILVGSQSGERASTEDKSEWNETCQSRRNNYIVPNLMRIIRKLVRAGVLPECDWYISWSDLTESGMDDKVARVEKMAKANQAALGTGEVYFDVNEVRAVLGYEPREDDDTDFDDVDDDEQDA